MLLSTRLCCLFEQDITLVSWDLNIQTWVCSKGLGSYKMRKNQLQPQSWERLLRAVGPQPSHNKVTISLGDSGVYMQKPPGTRAGGQAGGCGAGTRALWPGPPGWRAWAPPHRRQEERRGSAAEGRDPICLLEPFIPG